MEGGPGAENCPELTSENAEGLSDYLKGFNFE